MIRRLLTSVLVFALCAIGPLWALERSVAGAEAPEFLQAIDTWLEGDDLAALSALAALSRDGNAAAQIFLARVATRAPMHEHVTKPLPRKERVALLRKPGGLSGKSWLTEAETSEPLATAFAQSTRIGEKAGAIAALIEFGEPQTAMIATQSMLLQGEAREAIEILEGNSAKLPPEAIILAEQAIQMLEWEKTGGTESDLTSNKVFKEATEIAKFEWFAPSPVEIRDNPARRAEVIEALPHVTAWTPVREFCKAHCAATAEQCSLAGVVLLPDAGPFAMRSPVESFLPDARYWASARMDGDLARSIRPLGPDEPFFSEIDACFVDAVRARQ